MSDAMFVRRATANDIDAVLSVEALCKSVTWSSDAFKQELSDKDSLALVGCAGDGSINGFIVSHCVADECTITTIGVAPFHQRRGMGRLLVQALVKEARRGGATTLFLEVRSKNSKARAFYTSLGFSPLQIRRAYYRDDGDDAIAMSRRIVP